MLKPDFSKKGMGKEKVKRKKRKKWKERKRKKNGNKEKRKERRIPDQRSKGSKNGKEAILNQWEREYGRSSDQINFWPGK